MNETQTFNYSQFFHSADLQDFVNKLYDFEAIIEDDIVRTIISELEKLSEGIKGDLFIINQLAYKVHFQFDEYPRIFNVFIYNADPIKKYNEKKITTTINGSGRVRKLLFSLPSELFDLWSSISELLQKQVEYAYLSLEAAFIDRFTETENILTKHLYEIIEIELKSINKPKLISKIKLTITKLVGTNEQESQFQYYFNSRVLRETIDYLKKSQLDSYSPLEIIINLLSENPPDNFANFYSEQSEQLTMNFNDMDNSLATYINFWNAEKVIYGDEKLALIYLSNKKGYLLAANYPSALSNDIKSSLFKIQPILESEFERNLNEKKFIFSFGLKKRAPKPSLLAGLSEFIASVIAKFAVEILKG